MGLSLSDPTLWLKISHECPVFLMSHCYYTHSQIDIFYFQNCFFECHRRKNKICGWFYRQSLKLLSGMAEKWTEETGCMPVKLIGLGFV